MQITKAMELVASSKLRKAKERQERCRPYFTGLKQTLESIETATHDFSSPYQQHREVKKRCLIVIAGDRGLAGGYNSNVQIRSAAAWRRPCLCAADRQADGGVFRAQRCGNADQNLPEAASVSVADCFTISNLVTQGYLSGQYDEVSVVYTRFVSMLTQTPAQDSLRFEKLEGQTKPAFASSCSMSRAFRGL